MHTATYYCSLLSLKLVLALGADVNRVDKVLVDNVLMCSKCDQNRMVKLL